MTKLLLATCMIAAISAPAFAQAPNDTASQLRRGHDYSEGVPTHHRHMHAHARRHHSSAARSDADHSAADRLNEEQLAKSRP